MFSRNSAAVRRLLVLALISVLVFVYPACDSKSQPVGEPAALLDGPGEPNPYWNDVARHLAGLDVRAESPLKALESKDQFKRQRDYFHQQWDRIEGPRLNPMRAWAAAELADARAANRPVFYPFGGPDYLHVAQFFPEAPLYVQFGLEPAGAPPDLANMNERDRANLMQLTRVSLSSVLRFSFFRTNDMRVELLQSRIGAVPVLMAFAVRCGKVIVNARSAFIDREGRLQYGAAPAGTISGVRIDLEDAETKRPQTLLYFSLDISNSGDNAPFFTFMRTRGPFNSYAKAASYLMHRDAFTRIRDFTLEHSALFMQDDSGMPVRAFRREAWDLTFYGAYDRPIALFRNLYQADLREIYRRGTGVKPLPFGIGYVYQRGKSNLMIARKKTGG